MEFTKNMYIAIIAAVAVVVAGVALFVVLSKSDDDAVVLYNDENMKIEHLGGDMYRFTAQRADFESWKISFEGEDVEMSSMRVLTVSLTVSDKIYTVHMALESSGFWYCYLHVDQNKITFPIL
ncbi:MAG: hypothetical protein LBE47_01080 [Methanomassiliicoccaceae archaeon]|jgi:hypothetical protein|nr:hypothetical protein [Methanomassiliicoccaceae archaeon]